MTYGSDGKVRVVSSSFNLEMALFKPASAQ